MSKRGSAGSILDGVDSTTHDTSTIQKDTVSALKSIFLRQSKKNVTDNSRRRTLDEHQLIPDSKDNEEISLERELTENDSRTDDDAFENLISPEKPKILDIASKIENISSQPKRKTPRFSQTGNVLRSSSLKHWRTFEEAESPVEEESIDDIDGSDEPNETTSTINGAMTQIDSNELSKTSSIEVNSVSNTLAEEPSVEEEPIDISVTDLVNLHAKIIRENSTKRKQREARTLKSEDDTNVTNDDQTDDISGEITGEDNVDQRVLENDHKEVVQGETYNVLVHGQLKQVESKVRKSVQRVQSFPGSLVKRRAALYHEFGKQEPLSVIKSESSTSDNTSTTCQSDQSVSLPTSPYQLRRRRSTWEQQALDKEIVRSSHNVYLSMEETEKAESGVRNIVNNFETRSQSFDSDKEIELRQDLRSQSVSENCQL